MSVKHSTTAIGTDSTDGLIGKSAWNADHVGINDHAHSAAGDGGITSSHGCRAGLSADVALSRWANPIAWNVSLSDTDGYLAPANVRGQITGLAAATPYQSTTLNGTGTKFTTELSVGSIVGSGGTDMLTVRSIQSDTLLTLWQPVSSIGGIGAGAQLFSYGGATIPLGLGGLYLVGQSLGFSENPNGSRGGTCVVVSGGGATKKLVVSAQQLALPLTTTLNDAMTVTMSSVVQLNDLDIVIWFSNVVTNDGSSATLLGGSPTYNDFFWNTSYSLYPVTAAWLGRL